MAHIGRQAIGMAAVGMTVGAASASHCTCARHSEPCGMTLSAGGHDGAVQSNTIAIETNIRPMLPRLRTYRPHAAALLLLLLLPACTATDRPPRDQASDRQQ